jgi:hypothetical protein
MLCFQKRQRILSGDLLKSCTAYRYIAEVRTETHDILERKRMLRQPGLGISASNLSENFILEISAKATHIRMLCRSDSVDDGELASSSLHPSTS